MKTSYSDLLKSPKWQKKRLEIMKRDKFKCKKCGDTETELHVHHIEYSESGNPWDSENKFLVTLCKDCHEIIEEIKKKNDNFILFSEIKIYKSNNWEGGGHIIFKSYLNKYSMDIYEDGGGWLCGFNFSRYDIKNISNHIKAYLNGSSDNL